ncbi:MAG: hypothetical protein ACJ8AW_53415, partial [Rhodopila sp.]
MRIEETDLVGDMVNAAVAIIPSIAARIRRSVRKLCPVEAVAQHQRGASGLIPTRGRLISDCSMNGAINHPVRLTAIQP